MGLLWHYGDEAYFFVIAFVGLSKVSSSNKSSFKSPRPASGSSSSSSLLSFFTYKQ